MYGCMYVYTYISFWIDRAVNSTLKGHWAKKKTFKGALKKIKIKGNDTIFFLLKVSVLLTKHN